MQHFTQIIDGIDGSRAELVGYVIDNSPEMDPDRRRPAILIIPGGGYAIGSDRESEPVALQFLAAGYQAFVLKYSCVPSRYPVALLEMAEAMSMIRGHADEGPVDAGRVAAIGFSAGGHLAANLTTVSSDAELRDAGYDPAAVRPDALLLCYPVITSGRFAHRGSFDNLLGDGKDDASLLELLSIEKHVDATMPPVFIWHTITDQAVPVENSLLMIQACRDAGVSVEAHLFPQGGHGLSLATVDTARAGRADLAAARLRLAPPHVRREVKAAVGGSQAHSRISRACALAVRRHRAWVIASLCVPSQRDGTLAQ